MERSRGVWLAAGVVFVGSGLAAVDHRLAAVLVLAALLAGWIWNPLSGQNWERFAGVLVLQMSLLVPLGLAARWLNWQIIWMVLVLLLGAIVVAGVGAAYSGSQSVGVPSPLDSWWLTRWLQIAVVVVPSLVVGLPYLTRDTAGHLWLFSRGFDNSAHFNVTSAIAKTGAWPWGERFAEVSGQLIFAPALPQQIWATAARVLSLGGLPPGDLLVTSFALGQVGAYAFLSFGVVLLFRQLVLTNWSRWSQVFGLALLICLLSFSSSVSLILIGFGNYAWGIAGVVVAMAGALILWQGNFRLSLTLILCGGLVAAASYSPLALVALSLALVGAWRLRSAGGRGGSAASKRASELLWRAALVVLSLVLLLLLSSILRFLIPTLGQPGSPLLAVNFFPIEALAETGGIEIIPWVPMVLLVAGAIVYLLFVARTVIKPSVRKADLLVVSFAGLGVAVALTVGTAAYSLAEASRISYYATKFQYLLLLLAMPFFAAALAWLFTRWRTSRWVSLPTALVVLFLSTQLFGYSLPFGQRQFLATGLPPNYISPGLGWLQLTDDPSDYQGFPAPRIAKAGLAPAEGVVVVWNPPGLAPTQERAAQVYANSMRYTGDTWVWSLADTLLGTKWGDEALEQLWNWRWSNWFRSVTIYVSDQAEADRLRARLPEFVDQIEGGIAGCVADGTCVTEIKMLK